MKIQNNKLNTTYLKDYTVPDFLVESIDLQFELGEDKTIVHSLLKIYRNPSVKHQRPLVLNGDSLELISLRMNEIDVPIAKYTITEDSLTISEVPDSFTLEIITQIYPQKNTALSGLYLSQDMFCTQCEAQGFRRITYYLDRPDVMALFTTTIVADKSRYPVLLSNGNLIEKGEQSGNRHWVKWQDPFKKPCYLFALLAGNLVKISDTFITQSHRKIALEIFVEPENKDKCDHAMRSLKKAMQWDEQQYGREYDLDIYMIVAANDFNMGAMENKGLNIFNSKYVLANEKTATDIDFQNVEAVIGHEYFHNWTGNRITCRDWFQLSLKEGLTVFREQAFSSDMGSPTVKRISDVRIIRTRQFAEDAGPMAHPVRPESYIEINNFYTSTVYSKGAEVIRMLHTLLGSDGFRKGMDCYFERHDGQAVTIEDFVAALADANNKDLTQFLRWYHQAGTPIVEAKGEYDAKNKRFTLELTQKCPQTPDKKQKLPFLIPIKFALYDNQGKAFPLAESKQIHQTVDGNYLVLDQDKQTFTFENISSQPIPSLLGNFSAPVKLSYPYTEADLELLLTSDDDLFNRWDSAQRISTSAMMSLMNDYQQKRPLNVPSSLISAYSRLLKQPVTDAAFSSQLLSLPSFHYIAESLQTIDVDALIHARRKLIETFSHELHDDLAITYRNAHEMDDGTLSSASMGYRSLKNVCLYYLVQSKSKDGISLAQLQYTAARNMTDKIGALSALTHSDDPVRQILFDDFYKQYKHEPLVVNKWLALQAQADHPHVLNNIQALLKHEAFDMSNPNKVYALIITFSMSNPERFHDEQGLGYDFLADRVIELKQRNPQVAARLLEALTQWKRLDDKHGQLMKKALMKIEASGNLSEDVYEIVTKSLTT